MVTITIIFIYILSMVNLDFITKRLYGITFINWLKKSYYDELDSVFTYDFINVIILINYIIVFILSPILVNILFLIMLYFFFKK